MADYAPENLIFASLEPEEIHHYSFFMAGIKPGMLLGQPYADGSFYIGHLTNKRLILEPWKLPGFVGIAIGIVKTLTTEVSPSTGIDQVIKGLAKQSKDSLARTKFLVETKTYFSIYYKDIVSFETGRITLTKHAFVRVLTNVASEKDAFLFGVAKVHDNLKRGLPSGEWGTASNRNFCDFGNQFLLLSRAIDPD